MNLLKIFSIAFCTFVSQYAYCQSDNVITASVTYKVSYTAQNTVLVSDNCQLDISNKRSYFYSLGKLDMVKNFEAKRLRAQQTNSQIAYTSADFKRDYYKFNTLKDYRTKLVIVNEVVGAQNLGYVKDTLSTKGWKITDENQIINNLACKKAVSTKNNVKITAWFCPTIPIPDGPFYFYGLPGLIVKASNSLGWEAEITSLKYNKNKEQQLWIEPYALVSIDKVNKAKRVLQESFKRGILPGGGEIKRSDN